MRHTGGELPDRGQFLRVPDLLLQFLRLGHVSRDSEHTENLALYPLKRRDTHHDRPRLAHAGHHLDLIDLLGADVQGVLEPPAPVTSRQQREVGPPEQIVFPIAPHVDLAVHIGEPLIGIERIDDVIGVLEQILQILFCLFDLPRPLPHFEFELFAIRLELSFELFPIGDIAQLHHDEQLIGPSDTDQVHFHRRLKAGGVVHGYLLSRNLSLPRADVRQPSCQRLPMKRRHHVVHAAPYDVRLGIAERLLLALVHGDDRSRRIHHEDGIGD